jgi:hypothetical protein
MAYAGLQAMGTPPACARSASMARDGVRQGGGTANVVCPLHGTVDGAWPSGRTADGVCPAREAVLWSSSSTSAS